MNEAIRISLNGKYTEITNWPATTTLLDWLRTGANLRGTKEGCAEGDCGACTIALERIGSDGGVKRSAVNSCLTMLGQADGLGVRTIEGVASSDGALHDSQSAMAWSGGTQCGFCTPGFVMSAYAWLSNSDEAHDLSSIHDVLAGNLCRCTGYRPIVAALQEAVALQRGRGDDSTSEPTPDLVSVARRDSVCFVHDGQRFFAPCSLAEALELRAKCPDAAVLAGGTDLGLIVSKRRETIPLVIYVGKILELGRVEEQEAALAIGAAVTYTDALQALTRHYPSLRTYLTRLGSRQVRNMGTLGGNVGTASPIGDTLPILLALDARIKLTSAVRGARELPADRFFAGYRQTALQNDELIEAILIPRPAEGEVLFVDKISKRRDQDISSVCGAYRLTLREGVVRDARLAFGGMDAIPKRASHAEAALRGRKLDLVAASLAGEAMAKDFEPLSDARGTAEYRLSVCKNLMLRLYWRIVEPSIPVTIEAI